MPKIYPLEVKLFTVEKRKAGHSWDRVSELVSEEFKIQRPSRRQMSKWQKELSITEGLKQAFSEDARKKAEVAKGETLRQVIDGLIPTLLAAKEYSGEEFEYSGWRWFFQAVEEVLGRTKLEQYLDRYFKESKAKAELPPPNTKPKETRAYRGLR